MLFAAILLLPGCQKSAKSGGGDQAGSAPQSANSFTARPHSASDLKYFYHFYLDAPRSGSGTSYAHVSYASNVHQPEKSEGLDGLLGKRQHVRRDESSHTANRLRVPPALPGRQ